MHSLLGVCDSSVRPVMTHVFHLVVTVPLGWAGIQMVVPEWIRDYTRRTHLIA